MKDVRDCSVERMMLITYKSAPCSKPPVTFSSFARLTMSGIQSLVRIVQVSLLELYGDAPEEIVLCRSDKDSCEQTRRQSYVGAGVSSSYPPTEIAMHR